MFVDKVKDANKRKNNKKMIRDEEEDMKREAVCVSDKRQENVLLTKMELFKQFSELEIKETKANMKVCNVCTVHVLYVHVHVHVMYAMYMYMYCMYMYCMHVHVQVF